MQYHSNLGLSGACSCRWYCFRSSGYNNVPLRSGSDHIYRYHVAQSKLCYLFCGNRNSITNRRRFLFQAPAAFALVTFLLHEGLDKHRIRKHLLAFSLAAPLLAMITYFGISQVSDVIKQFMFRSNILYTLIFQFRKERKRCLP